MDRAEALRLLGSESAVDRLRAARALVELAKPADRGAIEAALRSESDAWNQSALSRLLDRRVAPSPVEAPEPVELVEDPAQLARDVRAQTTQELMKMIQHELQPLVGALRQAALEEGFDRSDSQVGQAIERIASFLAAVRNLHDASGFATHEEFNLSDLIVEVTESVREERRALGSREITVSLGRVDPFGRVDSVLTAGDRHLVRLAFTNVLRNALEASELTEAGERDGVVINWGTTDRDDWIATLDSGVGLPHGVSNMMKPGSTTKEHHLGMGLTVAGMAIAGLKGSIGHQPRRDGGVVCEIRWPAARGS